MKFAKLAASRSIIILVFTRNRYIFAAHFEPFQQCQKTQPATGYIWHWIIEMHFRETQRKMGGYHNQARECKA